MKRSNMKFNLRCSPACRKAVRQIGRSANQTRQMDLVDAMIEQQNLAEQFRNRW